MLHMVICKRRHRKVAMVIIGLEPDVDTLLLPYLLCGGNEVLR